MNQDPQPDSDASEMPTQIDTPAVNLPAVEDLAATVITQRPQLSSSDSDATVIAKLPNKEELAKLVSDVPAVQETAAEVESATTEFIPTEPQATVIELPDISSSIPSAPKVEEVVVVPPALSELEATVVTARPQLPETPAELVEIAAPVEIVPPAEVVATVEPEASSLVEDFAATVVTPHLEIPAIDEPTPMPEEPFVPVEVEMPQAVLPEIPFIPEETPAPAIPENVYEFIDAPSPASVLEDSASAIPLPADAPKEHALQGEIIAPPPSYSASGTTKKDSSLALLLELLPGLVGLLGIGWLYSGVTNTGALLLVAGLIGNAILICVDIATGGCTTCLHVPLYFIILGVSAYQLYQRNQKDPNFSA